MRQETTGMLFEGKKDRLRHTLDWIEENCNNNQKEEVSKLISEYDFLLTFPGTGLMRCTHELAGRQDSMIHHVPDNMEQVKSQKDLQTEIRNRKKLVNGLITEILELEKFLEEVKTK